MGRGTATLAWMPRGLLGSTDVHSINSVTNKYTIIYSCILSRKILRKNSVILIMMIRVQTLLNNLILIPMSRACERYWIQIWCGSFYNGLLPLKCHNMVTIHCFHLKKMRQCHYVWQPNSMKSSFVWNLIGVIKARCSSCRDKSAVVTDEN